MPSSDRISISFLLWNIKWLRTVFISDIFFPGGSEADDVVESRSVLPESSLEGFIGKILYQIRERLACCLEECIWLQVFEVVFA